MANIYNVQPTELIKKAAEELKKIGDIKPAEWACFVKTGVSRERPPVEKDWWYVRAASILRNVYRFGPIGVSKLRTKYGGKKNRGVRPERFYKASGNIIRKIMQQLAKAELIKEHKEGVHKGKVITPKGTLLLSKAADSLYVVKKEKPAKKEKKEEKIKEEKKEIKEEKPVKEEKLLDSKNPKDLETKEKKSFSESQKSSISEKSKTFQNKGEKKETKEEKKEEVKKEKTTDNKVNEIIEKAKEVVEKKESTAEKIVKELKKEKTPSAHELAAKKNG